MAFCTQCGRELVGGMKFCANCGKKIGVESAEQVPPRAGYQGPGEASFHHTTRSTKDASSGFGRAFGERTGNAAGCLVNGVVGVIIVIVVLIIIINLAVSSY